jgi:GR25 family glycosyltransferase involved in LPS biosynthesis
MRVGITANFQYSFFSSGSPQTVLSVAEVLRIIGNEIILINVDDKARLWWDDVNNLKEAWKVVHEDDIGSASLDCVIEVGTYLMKPSNRTGIKCIWLNRKAPLFHDVEASLFPFEKPDRCLEGVAEIWAYEELCSKDDAQYLEILTRKPVRLLPYSWTPSAVELHRQDTKAPVWQQVASMVEAASAKWSVHICETNMSSSSSATIPLLIMREVKKSALCELNPLIKIHNADNIRQTKFFQQNVLSHVFSDITDMSGQFIGRQRCIDWVYDPKSIVIAHSRFYDLRPYHFDCLWAGIPLVHNSRVLSKLGESVSKGFYADNEISQAAAAVQRVTAAPMNLEKLIEVRKAILDEFSPLSQDIQGRWKEALSLAYSAPAPAPAPAALANREKLGSVLRVGFTCMWDSFNPEYNMFTLMLEAAGLGAVVGSTIDGLKEGEENVDILIFGPFGKRWETVNKKVPKIHFTGENTDPVEREDVVLNLGFRHTDMNNGKYIRLPLWMLEINWFNADAERIKNPKPLPIDRCCRVFPEEISRKSKFCAFVVTNPCQPMRNQAFQWLNTYKSVDSAGRLFNTMGDGLFAGLGGGGGELKKHEFLKDYKFSLAYENAQAPGYTTEKWLHAKAAGCIPIYWGDPKLERDFDIDGCIDAREAKTSGELIRLVKEVDTNSSLWLKKLSKPALDEVRRDLVRRTLSECAKRIWVAAGATEAQLATIPRLLGDTETMATKVWHSSTRESSSRTAVLKDIPPTSSTAVSMDNTIFVTGTNSRFLSSLHVWLNALAAQKKEVTEIHVIVYLFDDVSEEAEKNYKDTFPFVEMRRLPQKENAQERFADFWDPQHFAWKLWILNECMNEDTLSGKPLVYLDTGVMMCRWPREWIGMARDKGICLLEDPRQKNKSWCHEIFNKTLKVTETELGAQQLWAGAIACIAGHPLAKRLFSEAYSLACVREVIVGEKWSGMRDGDAFGHRHDQSILSILSMRMNIPRYDMDKIYCGISLRQTFLTQKALYVHRGLFQVHHALATGIDDAWVINLDRRGDRMEKFLKTNADIAERVHRISAFEGSKLKMTPKLARLFKPHDFNWKKPVMGCALSHLALWMQLANEKEDIHNYLILEDDARLSPDWRARWEKIYSHDCMPADWDVVYLGGILPPNKGGFAEMIEPVNKYVARIKKNTNFGQVEPDRYMHFCAYAYVLSRRGAIKILDVLKAKGGYWTSADHMICNIHQILNIYFTNPLTAGCFQDDDPVYCNSQFNDFSRVDKFDSDLWNNTERFSEEEVAAVMNDDPLDISGTLAEARRNLTPAPAPAPAPVEPEKSAELPKVPTVPMAKGRRFVSVAGPPMDMSTWYEYAWMKQMFSFMESLEITRVVNPAEDCPIVVVQRPNVEESASVLKGWSDAGLKFFVLHMSDEFCADPIDFYELEGCKGVIRNYMRDGLSSKVIVIPLGFHWAIPNGEPHIHTPRPPFRELLWSFVGTNWMGRKEKLSPLTQAGEHKMVFMDDWNSPKMIGREECLSILLNSWCVPCPSGHNGETFRFYEALEAGAVPIVVKEGGAFLKYISQHIQIMPAESWQHAAQLIYTLKAQPEVYEKYRVSLLIGWENLKNKTKESIRELLK